MTSREKILAAVRANKPALTALPEINIPVSHDKLVERFTEVATAIGARFQQVADFAEITRLVKESFNTWLRVISSLPEFSDIAETDLAGLDPHSLQDVELAIIKAEIAVAENGASWVPEDSLQHRVMPFICQHLAIVLDRNNFVPTMHQAYERIGTTDYGYGAFIAGPSKTADIEQSLVLGAHGPRSLTIFVI